MTELRTAEIGGLQWWAGSRAFSSARVAARAFEDLTAYGQRLRGELRVGTYRHGEPDEDKCYITIVGLHRDGVVEALERIGGEPYELHPELLTRLVLRRARVVASMEGAAPGAYRFPHGAGIRIGPLGEVEQP